MHEYQLSITNLTCAACQKVCAMVLKKIDGVESVDVQEDGTTKITSRIPLSLDDAKKKLSEQGYTAVTN